MPQDINIVIPRAESVWKRVNKTESCWEWTGAITPKGYGRFAVWSPHRTGNHWFFQAHRIVWFLVKGVDVPVGTELDHLCRNRRCVNPSHLEPVTHAENIARSAPATKTHCKYGHPLSGDNLQIVIYPHKRERRCKTCTRIINRRAQAKRTQRRTSK